MGLDGEIHNILKREDILIVGPDGELHNILKKEDILIKEKC